MMVPIKRDQSRSTNSLLNDIVTEVRVPDLLLIMSVPLILSLVFILPKSIQNGLILEFGSPSIINLWSSAFLHRGLNHFIANTILYCILIVPIYSLFVLAQERTLFRFTFVSFLLVLPAVIALVNIAVINQGTGAGFSGIDSAFFGVLPLSFVLFIQNRISSEIEQRHSVPLFLMIASIIAFVYSGVFAFFCFLFVALSLAIYQIYQLGFPEIKKTVNNLLTMRGYLEMVVFSAALFLLSPVLLFPQEIVQQGHTVNILSHYVGLVFGFFEPLLISIYR